MYDTALATAALQRRVLALRRTATALLRTRRALLHEQERAQADAALVGHEAAAAAAAAVEGPALAVIAVPGDRRVVLSVGGELHEVSAEVLARDPGSLLAAVAADDCPVLAATGTGERACVVFDRDPLAFRHVMTFMRTGRLPRDRRVLPALYAEAAWFRVGTLVAALEDLAFGAEKENSKEGVPSETAKAWAGKAAGAAGEAEADGEPDFWTAVPTPLSALATRVVAEADSEAGRAATYASVWARVQ